MNKSRFPLTGERAARRSLLGCRYFLFIFMGAYKIKNFLCFFVYFCANLYNTEYAHKRSLTHTRLYFRNSPEKFSALIFFVFSFHCCFLCRYAWICAHTFYSSSSFLHIHTHIYLLLLFCFPLTYFFSFFLLLFSQRTRKFKRQT